MADRHPHNDSDLTLAEQLKKLRSQGRSLSELDDPLMPDLLEYRKMKESSEEVEAKDKHKQDMWNHINSATKPDNKRVSITRLYASPAVRWAAAAVVIIAGIFSFIYLRNHPHLELLAASGQSIKTVTLKDGSTVKLRPHSKLFLVKKNSSAAVYSLQGEARFDVTHNPNRVFTVKTQLGSVSVLGTHFILSSWGQKMQVYLQKGKVKVETRNQTKSVILSPGESASVVKNKPIQVVKKAQADEFTDWLDHELIFRHESVRQVISELEQQFNISLILPPDIGKRKVSGSFSLKNLPSLLDDLGLILNGSFTKIDKREYKFKAAAK